MICRCPHSLVGCLLTASAVLSELQEALSSTKPNCSILSFVVCVLGAMSKKSLPRPTLTFPHHVFSSDFCSSALTVLSGLSWSPEVTRGRSEMSGPHRWGRVGRFRARLPWPRPSSSGPAARDSCHCVPSPFARTLVAPITPLCSDTMRHSSFTGCIFCLRPGISCFSKKC